MTLLHISFRICIYVFDLATYKLYSTSMNNELLLRTDGFRNLFFLKLQSTMTDYPIIGIIERTKYFWNQQTLNCLCSNWQSEWLLFSLIVARARPMNFEWINVKHLNSFIRSFALNPFHNISWSIYDCLIYFCRSINWTQINVIRASTNKNFQLNFFLKQC